MKCLSLPLALLLLTSVAPAEPLTYTYPDLVGRLTDLRQLSVPPLPGETCKQFSSYDRKSRYEVERGRYIDWEANGDNDGMVRTEGGRLIMAEMEGPGCLWRLWSAAPGEGHVRIYLDGATEPAIDLPFKGYFDGKNEPFTRGALVHTVARGWNNYTPIPFQKSCRIEADPKWGAYYQFVYSTYPAGTRVPTFNRQLTGADLQALDAANATLTQGGPAKAGAAQKETRGRLRLQPGETATLVNLNRPGAISSLRVRPILAPDQAVNALRELALRCTWDNEAQPAVWSPLGDFFGTAPGLNAYRSLPLGCTGDGWLYSNWYMPFASAAHVELVNDGETPREVEFAVIHEAEKKAAQPALRFHAKWHRDLYLPPNRGIDWTMLTTTGQGRFAGVMLHIWNPRGAWWGEGDEKFFVDGEHFPSTFGTGSEDYFGYAWCDPGLFQNAYHNQTYNDGNNRGHVSVNRWHVADNVPFQKSFNGDIEKYFPNRRPTLYAAVAYWYLAAGGVDPYPEAHLSERLGYWGEVRSNLVPGAIEGEKLKIVSKTAGNPHPQDVGGFGDAWSGDTHLWWIEAKPGDKLELAFPAPKAGRFRVFAQMTRAKDYGIFKLSVNGRPALERHDLYHPEVTLDPLQNLGEHDLTAGENRLLVEILGANEQAVKSYMFGLDYLRLEEVK